MKIAIIVSKKDPAGMNIRQRLLESYQWEKINNEKYQLKKNESIKLYIAEKESIFCEDIDKEIEADLFVFATKHQSSSGIHSLCVHSPGNWGKAEFGGKDKKLCTAPARYLRTALFTLKKNASNLNYEIIQEVTHHGPFLEKPCFFIEIGSNLESWKNKKAAEIISKTIMEVLEQKDTKKYAIAFGIGGLHHTPILTRVMEKTDIAFGHVCPKYNLHNLDKEMILQAIEKTQENVDFVVLDWKGLGKEKQRILDLLKELNLEVKRSDRI